MKTTIFNFIVLQVVVWAYVFSSGENSNPQQVNYAAISDTWEVAQLEDNQSQGVYIHYPSFNKLVLNLNGTYVRQINDETLEAGSWKIDEENSTLTLVNKVGIQQFDIVQLPSSSSESFIIKENIAEANNSQGNIRYELTRM